MSARSGAAVPGGAREGPANERGRDEIGRRTIHAASGVLGPLAAAAGTHVATPGFAVLVALAGGAEFVRMRWPRGRRALDRLAGRWFRPAEGAAVSGASLLALGYALAWWLFPAPAAERAILVAALADPMAATVGTRFGGGRRKSWAGTAACTAMAAGVLLLTGLPLLPTLAGAAVAGALERTPGRGTDNVLVPLGVGAALSWLA